LVTSQPSRLPIASFAQQPFYAAQQHLHGASLARLSLIQSPEIDSSADGHGALVDLAGLQ
jgi:hypothetical protein